MNENQNTQYTQKLKTTFIIDLSSSRAKLNSLITLPFNQTTLIIDFQVSSQHQTMSFALPQQVFVPHSSRQLHPKNRGGGIIFPMYPSSINISNTVCTLMVALVERAKIDISNDIIFIIKCYVKGIVVNSLVYNSVFEFNIVVDSFVVGSYFFEGKNVKFFNGASWSFVIEEKP